MTIGHNTIHGQDLLALIERIERLEGDKKAIADDVKLVYAEAKSKGFEAKAIRACVKVRRMKPADRQEAEQILDTYLHAIGMVPEPPLFRAVGLLSADIASRDSVIEAMKKLVPEGGEIVVKAKGGKPVRLWRDKDGTVHSADHVERPAAAATTTRTAAPARMPVPDVDEDGAEELGRLAARENEPIIANPFPHDDKRRPRFDKGWRDEAGSDGMGD